MKRPCTTTIFNTSFVGSAANPFAGCNGRVRDFRRPWLILGDWLQAINKLDPSWVRGFSDRPQGYLRISLPSPSPVVVHLTAAGTSSLGAALGSLTARGIAFHAFTLQGIRVSILDGDLDGDRHHRSGILGLQERPHQPLPIAT